MTRELLGCAGVHNIYNVSKYIIIHSYILYKTNFMKHLVILIIMSVFKMLMNNVIPIPCVEWCREHVNDIELRGDLGDFYKGLLSRKCHNVVTIDCFQCNMRSCHYASQQNSMKSSFVWIILNDKGKVLLICTAVAYVKQRLSSFYG